MDLTICVVLDDRTAEQFKGVFPTWLKMKPWLRDYPWLIVYDAAAHDVPVWTRKLSWLNLRHCEVVPWMFREDLPQRERMLTAWVKEMPRHIGTKYFAKIDTDVVATSASPWPLPEWFEGGPAIIAPPWSYTKPKPQGKDWGQVLDTWAAGIEELRDRPSLNLPPLKDGKIRHKRVCGWCQIIRTNFAYRVSQWFESRMPVPSQDTYHWYCAARMGEPINTVRMNRHGWKTVNRDRSREVEIKQILGETENGCCGA